MTRAGIWSQDHEEVWETAQRSAVVRSGPVKPPPVFLDRAVASMDLHVREKFVGLEPGGQDDDVGGDESVGGLDPVGEDRGDVCFGKVHFFVVQSRQVFRVEDAALVIFSFSFLFSSFDFCFYNFCAYLASNFKVGN